MLLGEELVGHYVSFAWQFSAERILFWVHIFFEKDLNLADLILSCSFRSIAAVIFIGC